MSETKKRKPLLAAFLSLMCMGLGQLYNGELRKALMFFGISIALVPLVYFLLSSAVITFLGFLFSFVLVGSAIGVKIWAIIDAFRRARNLEEVEVRPFMRWYVYVLVVIVLSGIDAASDVGSASRIEAFSAASDSMAPALWTGDHFMTEKRAFSNRMPRRGEIVVFKHPDDTESDFVKRVIGIPGDHLRFEAGALYLNGALVDDDVPASYPDIAAIQERLKHNPMHLETIDTTQPYLVAAPIRHLSYYGPATVPEGHVFVLGDNRDNSNDSRYFGFVPLENLAQSALYIYWSDDFSRIGKSLN